MPRGRPARWSIPGRKHAILSDNQFERLKRELEDNYQGAVNAGRPLLLEGGLDWKAMSLSPKDMDFLDAKHNAAREIALCFGVPPMLLGIPGDNTYANYQEANRAFCRSTVLPLVCAHRLRAVAMAVAGLWAQSAACRRRRPDRCAGGGSRGVVEAGERGAVPDAEREAHRHRLYAGGRRGRAGVRWFI